MPIFLSVATHTGPCALPHCFNLTTSGSRLGEFAAILTALTFSAIIFLAERNHGKDHLEDTQVMLLAAFLSLATAAYLFSGVASEEAEGPRTAFEAFAASLVLSISLQLLFLGITHLLDYRHFRSAMSFSARVSNWFVGPTIFAFMSATAASAVNLYAPSSDVYRSAIAYVCAGLFAILAVWMGATHRLRRRRAWPKRIKPTAVQWASGCVGIVALSSALTLLWSEMSRNHAMPDIGYIALMALLLVATMGFSLRLTFVGESVPAAHLSDDVSPTLTDDGPRSREGEDGIRGNLSPTESGTHQQSMDADATHS